METPTTIADYTAQFPEATQTLLRQMHDTIKAAAPDAEESISYGLPTFKLAGRPVVYYGAFPHHIGFYATPDGHAEFEKELSKYKRGKGSVQFPADQPLPLELVSRITRFKVSLITK